MQGKFLSAPRFGSPCKRVMSEPLALFTEDLVTALQPFLRRKQLQCTFSALALERLLFESLCQTCAGFDMVQECKFIHVNGVEWFIYWFTIFELIVYLIAFNWFIVSLCFFFKCFSYFKILNISIYFWLSSYWLLYNVTYIHHSGAFKVFYNCLCPSIFCCILM